MGGTGNWDKMRKTVVPNIQTIHRLPRQNWVVIEITCGWRRHQSASVCTAEPERIDYGVAPLLGVRKSFWFDWNFQIERIKGDVGVWIFEADVWWNDPGFHGHRRFNQTRYTRPTFQVTDVGFAGPDIDGMVRCALANDRSDGTSLNRVANRGAGAMRLNEPDLIRPNIDTVKEAP